MARTLAGMSPFPVRKIIGHRAPPSARALFVKRKSSSSPGIERSSMAQPGLDEFGLVKKFLGRREGPDVVSLAAEKARQRL